MAKAVTTPARSGQGALITRMAVKAGLEPNKFFATINDTIMPRGRDGKLIASQEQVAAFLSVADNYNLNPFTKEIFAFPSKGGGIVPVVSIDGWATLINRQPNMDGLEFVDEVDDAGNLVAITARIFRKDRSHATEITEYMAECARDTEVWKKWPRRMLRHKALIQCARIAFGLSGIYDEDEAQRISSSGPAPFVPSPPSAPQQQQQRSGPDREQAQDVEAHDPDTGEIADEGEDAPAATAFDKFCAELEKCKTIKAIDRVWNAYSGDMPEDDREWAEKYQAAQERVEQSAAA